MVANSNYHARALATVLASLRYVQAHVTDAELRSLPQLSESDLEPVDIDELCETLNISIADDSFGCHVKSDEFSNVQKASELSYK